jgi:hypothetical protein
MDVLYSEGMMTRDEMIAQERYPNVPPRPWPQFKPAVNQAVYMWLLAEQAWSDRVMDGSVVVTRNMVLEVLFKAWYERTEEERALFARNALEEPPGTIGSLKTRVRRGRPKGNWRRPWENYRDLRPDQP